VLLELENVQHSSADTLGVLARSVGPEHFLPLAQETVQLGLSLLSKTDDPELRKSCYGLFAALSTVLKGDMRNILPTIVEIMLDALKSVEGIVVSKVTAVSCYIMHAGNVHFLLNHFKPYH
jgi:hypothetical protein